MPDTSSKKSFLEKGNAEILQRDFEQKRMFQSDTNRTFSPAYKVETFRPQSDAPRTLSHSEQELPPPVNKVGLGS